MKSLLTYLTPFSRGEIDYFCTVDLDEKFPLFVSRADYYNHGAVIRSMQDPVQHSQATWRFTQNSVQHSQINQLQKSD